MVYDYVVYLKNERGRFVNYISLLLSLISAAFFLVRLINSGTTSIILVVSPVVILGGLAWNWYIFRKKKRPVFYRRILLVAGATWFAMPFLQWLGIPILALSFLEKPAKMPLEIGITEDRIVFNTLYKRRFAWRDFNNVLLKDGILTLDFKNNRLFQKETADVTDAVDEYEFNEYCKKQLAGPGRCISL